MPLQGEQGFTKWNTSPRDKPERVTSSTHLYHKRKWKQAIFHRSLIPTVWTSSWEILNLLLDLEPQNSCKSTIFMIQFIIKTGQNSRTHDTKSGQSDVFNKWSRTYFDLVGLGIFLLKHYTLLYIIYSTIILINIICTVRCKVRAYKLM